uniref:Retrovirus-related Pol polyprotein from transposon TNT 1-94-like beta-barrel domain-containing protein n=2 Tax=Nicotiana TaxID=4085 RepID=A0A1S3Z367_TOBAC|nr:PREDICTED: uncharacterized protein LOC104231227 [Nicotiana sylvestris]XP_016458880.1 PREDICTED: uncharacterized protein LOC107782512 [Nicotiana tabacum]
MIVQLKSVGHALSDEQQVQAVIRSLSNNWEYLKVNLTHNDSIKIFADVVRHVKLEDERLGAAKYVPNAFVVESSGTKRSSVKRKRNWKNDGKDSGATDHVSRDREAFIEFRQVPPRSKYIYVRNNAKLEVKGIGTCRMDMCVSRSLILHDILYVPKI